MNRTRATAGDVLGVPLLPRARSPRPATGSVASSVACTGRWLRVRRILEGLFGILERRALVVLCQAGVPDALTGPMAVPRLAHRLGADPVLLDRLLRYAATNGWVRLDRRGRVRPTRLTAFLRNDHPGGWRAWVQFAGGQEIVAAVGALSVDAESTDASWSVVDQNAPDDP